MVVKKVKPTEVEKKALSAQAEASKKAAAIAKASFGVKETKEMLQLAFGMAKIVREAKANDGMFSSADLVLLTQLFPLFTPALDGASLIVKELKDLDQDEINDLLKFTASNLGGVFDSKEMVAKVEAGLELALAISKMVRVLS